MIFKYATQNDNIMKSIEAYCLILMKMDIMELNETLWAAAEFDSVVVYLQSQALYDSFSSVLLQGKPCTKKGDFLRIS